MERLDQAIYDTVKYSAMGAKKLAAIMKIGHQVFLNKANPNCDSNHFTAQEVVTLQLITGTTRIAEAMLDEVKLSHEESSESLANALLSVNRELGEANAAISDAIADGRITPRERERCCREINETKAALDRLTSTISAHP